MSLNPSDLVSIHASATRQPYLVIDVWNSFGQLRCTIITSRGPVNLWASELSHVEAA